MSKPKKHPIKCVLSDFDGTLTVENALKPIFFSIVSYLKEHDIPFVIVTGRSKSWGHFLLSHIPELDYVITEGGGTLSGINEKRLIWDKLLVDKKELVRLEEFTPKLLKAFPQISLSADSFGRWTDRAIELRELEGKVELITRLEEFFKEHDVNYSVSNVHINFWCGEFDKSKASTYFLKEYFDLTPSDCVFFGDSLNDEPVFKDYPHTVGVSNISKVLDRFNHKPSIILEGEINRGPFGVLNYLQSKLK